MKHNQTKTGTGEKDDNISLPTEQEVSNAANDEEVESSHKDNETGSENNVNAEETGPPSADAQAEGMFDVELQASEGMWYFFREYKQFVLLPWQVLMTL